MKLSGSNEMRRLGGLGSYATALTVVVVYLLTMTATSALDTTSTRFTSHPAETTVPTFTTTLGNSRLSVGSVESFLGKKLVDPATSIFVSDRQDDESSEENMARYFFFNSNVGAFNTSVSFTIPLFSFSMPDFSGSLLNDLGINTLFSLACLGILFFGGLALLPFIFAYYGAGTLLPFFGGRSLNESPLFAAWAPAFDGLLSSSSESLTNSAAAVEAAIAKFAAILGDQCAKRTVCEAHASAKKVDAGEEDSAYNEILANPLARPIRQETAEHYYSKSAIVAIESFRTLSTTCHHHRYEIDYSNSSTCKVVDRAPLLTDYAVLTDSPDHLLLDSAPNLGPLISRWEITKFENC
jgi:hypothetical protein